MRRLPVQALLLLLLLLPPPPEAAAQAPGFFWHISDVHVLYSRNVSWAEPIPNKPFGDHGADTIFESGLYQSLTAEMAALNPAPDFILLSGDISNEVRDIREATRILKQRFPTTFVYVSSGNHDVNLGFYNRANVTDPERLGPGTGTRDWIKSNSATEGDPDLGMASQRLGLLDSVWSSTGWLSSPGCPGCAASFRKAGVYSTAVATAPGLRVVNLNTNPWLGADLKPAAEANDPAEMFEYLEVRRRLRGTRTLFFVLTDKTSNKRRFSTRSTSWRSHATAARKSTFRGTSRLGFSSGSRRPNLTPGLSTRTNAWRRRWRRTRMWSRDSFTGMIIRMRSGCTATPLGACACHVYLSAFLAYMPSCLLPLVRLLVPLFPSSLRSSFLTEPAYASLPPAFCLHETGGRQW